MNTFIAILELRGERKLVFTYFEVQQAKCPKTVYESEGENFVKKTI